MLIKVNYSESVLYTTNNNIILYNNLQYVFIFVLCSNNHLTRLYSAFLHFSFDPFNYNRGMVVD